MYQGTGGALPYATIAGLSLETGNIPQFRLTADQLYQKFPSDPHAHLYQGIKQLQDGNWKSAEASLKKAVSLGLPQESVAALLKTAIDNQRWVWQFARLTLMAALLWILGIVLLYSLGKFLGIRTLRIIENSSVEAVSEHRVLTAVYRWVVNIAGIFYYLSIPMLVVFAIMLPLSICYALLMLPYLNLWLIGLVLTTGVGGVVTAISGIRTLFARTEDDSIDLPTVSREQAPQLWQMLDGLAQDLGTRTIDLLRVSPGAEFGVTERGSYWSRRRDQGQRVLLIGTALLKGLRQDALKGILAHEYAHFMNRDTAGGDVAIQVRRSMGQFAEAIVQRGPIRWWDLPVQFLRLYIRMFTSLTFGASRLAEVLADRVAVNCVGRSAFAEGLRHAIRRGAEWEQYLDERIHHSVKLQTVNGLSFHEGNRRMSIADREAVEAALREIWSEPSTHTNTHPSPMDRVRLADALNVDRPVSPALVTEMLGSYYETLMAHMDQYIANAVNAEARRIREIEQLILRSIPREANAQNAPNLAMDRALLLLRQGESSKGIAVLSEIIETYPVAPIPCFHRAMAYEDIGDHEQAAQDLRRVQTLIRETANTEQRLSVDLALLRVLVVLKDFTAAASLLESFDTSQLSSLAVRMAAIEVELGLGNQSKAESHSEYVRTNWPDSPELLEYLDDLVTRRSKDIPMEIG